MMMVLGRRSREPSVSSWFKMTNAIKIFHAQQSKGSKLMKLLSGRGRSFTSLAFYWSIKCTWVPETHNSSSFKAAAVKLWGSSHNGGAQELYRGASIK